MSRKPYPDTWWTSDGKAKKRREAEKKRREEEEEGVPIIEAFFKFVGAYFLIGIGFAMVVSNVFRHAGMSDGIVAGSIFVVIFLTVITGIGIFIGYVIEEQKENDEDED
jgi:hypothetical protein